MYHLRLKGSHEQAGKKRGLLFKKFNVHFPIHLDEFQMNYGIASGKILNEVFPEGYAEVKAITDTLQIDHNQFLAWMMCMGCCMYNLKDNIPEVRGCTAFAFTKNNQVYYGRNNDLPPFLKKGSKAELYQLNNASKFYMTTSSFINGEEGVNEHGVVIAMTFVTTPLEKIKPGLNSVFVVRYLLEKATSARHAIELIEKLPIASNMNILISDSLGEMIVAECSPNERYYREPVITNTGDKVIVTTNEFTSNKMKRLEAVSETYQANRRYHETLQRLLKINHIDDDFSEIKSILKGESNFICQYDRKDHFQTIWSTIVHLNTITISRAEGDPRKSKYKIDSRLKNVIK